MNTKQIYPAVVIVGLNACFLCLAAPNKQDKSDTPVPGYYIMGTNGEHIWNTNTEQFWRGVWSEDTNGWRVELNFYKTNTPDITLSVNVGSIVKKSGDEGTFYTTPDGGFAKFELLGTNGIVVTPKSNASLALARSQKAIYGTDFPSHRGASLEENFPKELSNGAFPRWPDGEIKCDFGFVSNGPPECIGEFKLNDVYSIKNEGDYKLTICPILYKLGSNQNSFDRVDLPCVTAKIHLIPNDGSQ